ncbi:hypothetical protein LR090_02795 [Candidatus Bipolaricaulota bacterium]|nr:hypothetical protein [Candidatus Bipolaricaulota bacterium]
MSRRGTSLLLGLALGVGIALAVGVGLLYLLPQSLGRTLPTKRMPGDRIVLHLLPQSPLVESMEEILVGLEQTLASLAQESGLGMECLPPKLNVFVHLDHSALLELANRREAPDMPVVLAPVDLIWGEDPRGTFIQVLGDYCGGANRSRLLRHGLVLALTSPDPPHLAAAALPAPFRLTLEELLVWEERGRFPPTRYEALNSPHTRPGVGGVRELRPLDPDLAALAHSFVAFLLEEWGLRQVMQLWRPGKLANNLELVLGLDVAELGQRWAQRLTAIAQTDAPLLVAQGRLRVGALEEALALLAPLPEPQAVRARARAWFLLGDRAASARELAALEEPGEVGYWLEATRGWQAQRVDGVVAHVAPEFPSEPRELAVQAAQLLEEMKIRLGISVQLPPTIVLFCGPQVVPPDLRSGRVTVPSPRELRWALAELVCYHLWKDRSWSQILVRGLVRYLAEPQQDYSALLIREAQRFGGVPLRLLDFSNYPGEMVEPLAAGLVEYLLEEFEPQLLLEVWMLTSPLGGRKSLDTALKEVYGFCRNELEEILEDLPPP